MKNKLIGVLVAVTLSSCAGASYKPYDMFGKGYQDSKITDDQYTVMFQADGQNTPLEAKRFFMRRCAELTLQKGYTQFEIISEQPGSKQNGPVSWPSHSGDIKLLKAKTAKSIEAQAYLASIAEK